MIWKASFWGLAVVVQVFVTIRNLFGDLWFIAAASASGADDTGEVPSPTLQGENLRPRYDLVEGIVL
jgi:hypothetical protein